MSAVPWATISVLDWSVGPSSSSFVGSSVWLEIVIVAQGTADMKLNLEQGHYTVSAEDSNARQTKLAVGPERPSSQNDLLLP